MWEDPGTYMGITIIVLLVLLFIFLFLEWRRLKYGSIRIPSHINKCEIVVMGNRKPLTITLPPSEYPIEVEIVFKGDEEVKSGKEGRVGLNAECLKKDITCGLGRKVGGIHCVGSLSMDTKVCQYFIKSDEVHVICNYPVRD